MQFTNYNISDVYQNLSQHGNIMKCSGQPNETLKVTVCTLFTAFFPFLITKHTLCNCVSVFQATISSDSFE